MKLVTWRTAVKIAKEKDEYKFDEVLNEFLVYGIPKKTWIKFREEGWTKRFQDYFEYGLYAIPVDYHRRKR